jgi:DNA polymerase III subunit gamma/tau
MTKENTMHVELYKKYRPTTWASLIGQERVAKSLRNAVRNNKLPTSFGFFGPRGCGKTSSALLLAKAINCLNLTETTNPCNECEVCINIDNNNQLGVNYISMANKGSTEDVRTIVQQARLSQPLNRQIWILDEVHNLSKTAFDALLIPIESSTMPSLFIFCSTEVDKIPQTILSRIQQRRFNLVDSDDMLKFVKKIAKKENLDLSEEELEQAVRLGRGSVRDTLSNLESIVETGETAPSFGTVLLERLSERNIAQILAVVAEASSAGVNCRDLGEQLFEDLRDLLLIASGVDKSIVGTLPIEDPSGAAKRLLGSGGISVMMDEIGEGLTRMTFGSDSRIHFEISIIKGLSRIKKAQKAREAASQK